MAPMPEPERSYPRAIVALQVDVDGEAEPLDVAVVPRRASVTRRPHTHADTAEVEIDGTQLPFDPRSVRSLALTVHMGQGRGLHDETWRTAATRRFIGFVDTHDGQQDDEDDVVRLKARDLSGPLRDAKPVPAAAVPYYTDTLASAMQRVLDAVPGGAGLRLVFPSPADAAIPLAGLVPGRHATGPVGLERDMTAWAVLEYVAGLCNRLLNVFLDELRVASPADSYASEAAPRASLVYGQKEANLLRLGSTKKFQRNRRGIRVVGWDPEARARLEADYPPDDQVPNRNRTAPAGTRRRGAPPAPPERDVFSVGGVQSARALRDIAVGIWQERSRQELSVTADTPYFTDPWLDLRHGDRVRLQLNRALASGLNLTAPRAQQVAFVQRRLSVDRRTAEVLVSLAAHPEADLFYVHEGTLEWNPEGDLGVKMELVNLIALGSP